MKFKDLAEIIGVSRPSIGRIVKREGVKVISKYCPDIRKRVKVISAEDAERLIKKYVAQG